MYVNYIRRFIFKLPLGEIFTTRQLLIWGTRSSVDVTLWRLVKAGVIVRLARGVFVREGSKIPSAWEIAQAKCHAFAKQIARFGADIAKEFELTKESAAKIIFTTTGRSSSFRAGTTLIQIKGISPRKMQLNQSRTGQAQAALWYLGRVLCDRKTIEKIWIEFFRRDDHRQLRLTRPLMPEWLGRYFLSPTYLRI